jgi:hypothetical protein
MKHIITLVALALATLTLSAKEVSKNPATGMTLSENLGVYTLTGKGGAIILGDVKAARNFMHDANVAFAQESLNGILNLGKDKFEVMKDDEGMYIVKVGLGGAKLRPSDTALFITVLEAIIVKDKAGKVWSVITE